MNKISATGRVVADAEVKFIPSGKAICNFRLASDVGFGDNKTTNWFSCQIWDKRGEALAPHLLKGQQVTVFGQLVLREWTNKEGQKQISPDIRIDEIELQGNGGGSQRESSPRPKQQTPAGDFQDPDIPF